MGVYKHKIFILLYSFGFLLEKTTSKKKYKKNLLEKITSKKIYKKNKKPKGRKI